MNHIIKKEKKNETKRNQHKRYDEMVGKEKKLYTHNLNCIRNGNNKKRVICGHNVFLYTECQLSKFQYRRQAGKRSRRR